MSYAAMALRLSGTSSASKAACFSTIPSSRVTRSAIANLDGPDDEAPTPKKTNQTTPSKKAASRGSLARANKTSRLTVESGTESGTSGDDVADDEDDESSLDDEDEEGDDSDEPAAFAPSSGSKNHSFRQAGLLTEYQRLFNTDDPVLYEDPHELFGEFDDENDDEVYQAVDDISDEDEQVSGSSPDEHSDAIGSDSQSSDESFPLAHQNEADLILGHVDGLSNYGFGDDLESDESSSSSAPSEDGHSFTPVERHVHFDSDVEPLNAYGPLTSPSLTRALLPSALPLEESTGHHSLYRTSFRQSEDPYDSDATEVTSQPATSIRPSLSNISRYGRKTTTSPRDGLGRAAVGKKRKSKASKRKRGPPRGMFTINKDKSWAVLDSTRTKILQVPAANTNRHDWLDSIADSLESQAASPDPELPVLGNAESMTSVSYMGLGAAQDTISRADREAILAAAANATNVDSYLSHGLQLVGGDYAVSPEPASELDEDVVRPLRGYTKPEFDLEDFLEDLSSDEYEEAGSQLPLYAPADNNLTAENTELSCLDTIDLSSFRQYADAMARPRPDPAQAFLISPIRPSHFAAPSSPIKSHGSSHKRKASSTPYQDEKIYGDVTPVERKVINAPKRRRIATL